MMIDAPQCSKCGTRTTLLRISSRPANYEIRVFECPRCERIIEHLNRSSGEESGPAPGLGG